jgi:hypothetical protein
MEAFCRLSQMSIFKSWFAASHHLQQIDLALIAAEAPVKKTPEDRYHFDPNLFFALLLGRVPPAGQA